MMKRLRVQTNLDPGHSRAGWAMPQLTASPPAVMLLRRTLPVLDRVRLQVNMLPANKQQEGTERRLCYGQHRWRCYSVCKSQHKTHVQDDEKVLHPTASIETVVHRHPPAPLGMAQDVFSMLVNRIGRFGTVIVTGGTATWGTVTGVRASAVTVACTSLSPCSMAGWSKV
jgi:hypothetical protein